MNQNELQSFLKIVDRIEEKKAKRRKIRNIAITDAISVVAVAITIVAMVLVNPKEQAPDTEFCALEGSSNIVTLPDSSTVRLLEGAKLIQYSGFTPSNRKVHLSGEAVFDVKSDAEHPFEILMDNECKVKVYGTKFDLSSPEGSDELTLTLLRGKVSIESQDMNCEVVPGETVRFSQKAGTILRTDINVADYQSWMDGNILFKNSTLLELSERLEGIYGVKIVLADNLRRLKNSYSISLNNRESMTSLLEALSVMLPISYVYEDNTVFISKK